MTPEEKRAYAKGYYAGLHRSWPRGLAVDKIPEGNLRRACTAALRLANAARAVLDVVEPDEEIFLGLQSTEAEVRAELEAVDRAISQATVEDAS